MIQFNCKIINERKSIVNEISLKKFITYTNSVYEIGEKINGLKRIPTKKLKYNVKPKTTAATGAKMIFLSSLCYHHSINELIITTHDKNTSLKNFFNGKEYIPKTHALRDCIIYTPYEQLVQINYDVLNKAKTNKFFSKNLVDGLLVCAWDGVELTETGKQIKDLPEREHKDGEIMKYIKYLCAMNVGPKANLIISTKQMTETEKVTTKKGTLKAKTFGETTAFNEMLPTIEQKLGKTIDVHVFDALYLNSNVMNLINNNGQYFVIRMNDDTKVLYQDAEGIFKRSKPSKEYEIVEVTEEINIKYSKTAKRKDVSKIKHKKYERAISNCELNKRELVETREVPKKNSVKRIKKYEKVIRRIQVWNERHFEFAQYKGEIRVVKSVETSLNKGKEEKQTVFIATNMLEQNANTIIKIMHLRWNIENNGFRKIKQQYNLDHIYIGEYNAINYIFQMIILVSNLIELYFKVRLKERISYTYIQLKKIFEKQINVTKDIGSCFDST